MTTIIESCRSLVEFKYSLDDQRDKYLRENNEPLGKAKFYSIMPCVFVRHVFPFLSYQAIGGPTIQEVNAFEVIGGTFQTYEDDGSEKVCDRINDASGSELGEYEKIGELPLYFAREGKNRVRLFQKHNRKIKAVVTPIKLPSPASFRLHKWIFGSIYLLSCTDSDFIDGNKDVFVLPFPDLTVPVYQSYGVNFGKSRLLPLFAATKERSIEFKVKSSRLDP